MNFPTEFATLLMFDGDGSQPSDEGAPTNFAASLSGNRGASLSWGIPTVENRTGSWTSLRSIANVNYTLNGLGFKDDGGYYVARTLQTGNNDSGMIREYNAQHILQRTLSNSGLPSSWVFTGVTVNAAGDVISVGYDDAGSTRGVYTYASGGSTWSDFISIPDHRPRGITLTPEGDIVVVVSGPTEANRKVYTRSAGSWDAGIAFPPGETFPGGLSTDPDGNMVLVGNTTKKIYTLKNGSWVVRVNNLPSSLTIKGVAVASNGDIWGAGQDWIVYRLDFPTRQYRVYQNGGQVASTPNLFYSNPALADGTVYTYTVAEFASGSVQNHTFPLVVVTTLSAPTNLSYVQNESLFRLSWTDNSTNETGFFLERHQGNLFQIHLVLPPNTTTADIPTDTLGNNWRVRAAGAYRVANSTPSNEVTPEL